MSNNNLNMSLDDVSGELDKLNKQLKEGKLLYASLMKFSSSFRKFSTGSEDFFKNWRSLIPGGAGGQPPPPDKKDDEDDDNNQGGGRNDPIDRRKSPLAAFFIGLSNKLFAQVKNIDDLQSRAMQTNTTLQRMNIPVLDVRMSKLANEIMDLRDVGFKNLNGSTLKLMSTMKATGQSTESMKAFLSNTSLSLRLNSTQVQEMSKRLTETAVSYGMSQDKVFQAVSKLSASLESASLMGKGAVTSESFAEIAAQIGDRATDQLGVVAEFLTGVGNESQAMIAGIFDIQNKFLEANKDQQVQLTQEAVRTFNANFRKFTQGLGTDFAGRRAFAMYAEQFGGMQNVRAFQSLEAAFQDSTKATTENNQQLTNLKTFEEKFADSMERSAVSLQKIVEMLPKSAFAAAGGVGGAAATVGGAIGTGFVVRSLASRLLPAAMGALISGPLGWVVGIGGAIATLIPSISSLLGSVDTNTKDTAKGVNDTNKILDPSKETPQTKASLGLIDVLRTMVASLGPQTDTTNKESLEVQKQMAQRLTELNSTVASRPMTQPVTFGLTR
jgi:hypothetical protein